jgi:hypothetical protein
MPLRLPGWVCHPVLLVCHTKALQRLFQQLEHLLPRQQQPQIFWERWIDHQRDLSHRSKLRRAMVRAEPKDLRCRILYTRRRETSEVIELGVEAHQSSLLSIQFSVYSTATRSKGAVRRLWIMMAKRMTTTRMATTRRATTRMATPSSRSPVGRGAGDNT